MKLHLLFFVVFVSVFAAFGQTVAPTPLLYSDATSAEMQRLQQAAVKSDYAYKQTGYLSNNIVARLSGSPQAERSVQWVAEQTHDG